MKRRSFLSRFAVSLASLPFFGKFFTEAAEAITYAHAVSTDKVDLSCIKAVEVDKGSNLFFSSIEARKRFMNECVAVINKGLQSIPDSRHISIGYRNFLNVNDNPNGDKGEFRIFTSGKANIPTRDPLAIDDDRWTQAGQIPEWLKKYQVKQ